ncbi:MAG: efflux RND transporter periplasmic adaptor subunit [Planctomycetota bacterium]|jgi:multidrug efflux pump subunit AcrA (membrane-fusion protein)
MKSAVLIIPIAVLSACSGDDQQGVLARNQQAQDAHEEHDVELASAGPGLIEITTTFPGEVILNPNRMAHIVPRAAGIVREVHTSLGDVVGTDQILAWIESDELAEAKLAFYAKQAELGSCMVELPRAQEIHESTNALLALLEKEPSAEELQELDPLEMGEHRAKLVTAYAEYRSAKKIFASEESLFGKSISSENELIAAEAAFKKAQAEFTAAKDIARYQVLIAYSEAARRRQVTEFEAVAAEQRLLLLGIGDDAVQQLVALVPQTGRIPSVMATLGAETRLGWYPLRAPFAGYITEKHLTLGEKVDGDESVMAIADTSSVWVRFNVYQKDLPVVKPGQTVRIELGAGVGSTTGTITYLAPTLDRETRTAPARVELQNPDGTIRPGLYATVHVNIEPLEAAVVVHRDAVQVLDEEEVVFVPEGDEYVAVPVRLGRADHERVIVLAGLAAGQLYVHEGAFELKAEAVTSGTDAHAGHGH